MKWLLHGCPACGGDLYRDVDDLNWLTCLMCARSYRAETSRLDSGNKLRAVEGGAQADPCAERPWLEGCGQAA